MEEITGMIRLAAFGLALAWGAYAQSGPINRLAPHEQESGLATRTEIENSARWLDAVTDAAPGQQSWFNQWLGQAAPFSFRYGGKESEQFLGGWQAQRNQNGVTWTDPATGLRVVWQTRRFADFPAVEWVLTFENTGQADTRVIADVQALNLAVRTPQKRAPYTVHGALGGRTLIDDMLPFSHTLLSYGSGRTRVMDLGGEAPSSNRHLPFFNIETPDSRGFLVGIGWSGNWLARLNLSGDNELRVRAGLKETHFVLHPGESVRSPRILLVFWEGKALHGNNVLRRLLYRHYVPGMQGEPQKPLVSVNVCFTHHGFGGFLHQATEQPLLALVQPFVKLGAELYIIDAGWYDGAPWNEWLGNWRYSRTKFPRGFRPISDPLSAAKVAFGLWFGSETVSRNAPVIREHPEFLRPTGARGYALRMDLPEAREWFLQHIDELVKNQGMNCFRQDLNTSLEDTDPARKGITEMQHIAGLYQMWDTMRQRYPSMIMEGCCGGGRRIDLETIMRFHWHQKSDRWYDSESDQVSLYGANLFLPGGIINIPTQETDDYGTWSSFAGQFSLGWHPLDTDFPMETARRQVDRYKNIRELLTGDFYPLTACSLEDPWIGYQFHRADRNKGFALVFRRPAANRSAYPREETLTVKLRGLDPAAEYDLRWEAAGRTQKAKGAALAKGVDLTLRPRGTEMMVYERAR